MRICRQIDSWNTSETELAMRYPCEDHAQPPYRRYFRAVDIDAPVEIAFRWLCQLKVAPYSYDVIDNLGRRSPTELTPGAEHLEIGQPIMIGPIVEFETDHHITIAGSPRADRLFGRITITYQVTPRSATTTRLVACMTVAADSRAGRLRRTLLGAGDLVMMRRELLNLKAHAERQHRQAVS